ncbi:DUF393 domain-containing protein [Bacteriovoracaceae bacterium]|nr:DUF393 domain-containing protein [Bacteriovoracaceae bacterium]
MEQKFSKPILLYDKQCPMCLRFKQGIQYIDTNRQIEFLDIYDPKTYEKITFLTQKECETIIHLVDVRGEVYVGADALTFLVKQFPQAQKLSWLLDSTAGQKAVEVFYDKVDQFRKWYKSSCKRC